MAASGSLGTISIDVLANIAGMVSDLGRAQAATSSFAEAAKENAERAAEAIEGVGESLKSLAEFAGIALGADAFKEVIAGALEASEQVSNMSKSFGFSTQAIQTMGFAAALVGGNLDTATAAMSHLEKSAEQAAAGSLQQAEAFKAIGISASQLAELIKTPDELLESVASHMASFGDGTGKTAAAMEIFGRGAATIIPLLDELGANFDELKERAANFGVVLSSQDQSALLEAQDSFNVLKEAASGAGNELAVAFLPIINATTEALLSLANGGGIREFFTDLGTNISQIVVIFGQVKGVVGEWIDAFAKLASAAGITFPKMGGDVVQFVEDAVDDLDRLITAFKNGWQYIQIGALTMWAAIETEFNHGVAMIEAQLGDLAKGMAQVFQGMGNSDAAATFAALSAGLLKAGASYKTVTADISDQVAAIDKNNAALNDAIAGNKLWADATRLTASSITIMTTGLDTFQASLVKGDIPGNLAKLATAQANIHDTAEQMIADGADEEKVRAAATASLSTMTTMVKQADSAQLTYNANAKDSQKIIEEVTKAWDELQTTVNNLQGKIDPQTKAWNDYVNSLIKVDQEGAKLIQLGQNVAAVQELVRAGVVAGTAEYQRQTAVIAALNSVRLEEGNAVQQLFAKYAQEADALNQSDAVRERVKAELEAEKAVRDAVTASIKSSTDATGQEQAALAASLPTLIAQAKAFADNGVAAKANQEALKQWQSIATQGFDSVGSSIAGFATGSIKNWHDFGQSLITDTEQFISAIIAEFLKLEVFNGIINDLFHSNLPTGLSSLASIGNLGSAGSSAESAAGVSPTSFLSLGKSLYDDLFGGVSTGFNLAADSGSSLGALGDIGDIGTAGIPGIQAGTYGIQSGGLLDSIGGLGGLTSIIGGAMAGYQIGGITGAAALGTLSYFVPVVGWIAGAASLINSLTGGGLFGTSAKAYGTEENIGVNSSGATINQMVDEKGKKGLFQGSYWETQNVTVDPTTLNGVNAFFTSVQKAVDTEAQAFGATAGTVVAGTFHETFDLTGKVLTNVSTFFGKQYSETIADFQTRELAESLLATIPAAAGAEQLAEQWRSSAATLLAGAEFLAQAQADIVKGNALVQGDTLAQLTTFVTGMEQQGETLIQTYARLEQETTTVNAIFSALGDSTGLTGEALVKFDDDLVTAAGSLSNLQSEFNSYFSEYYSQSEQQAASQKQLQQTLTSTFAAIGEDSSESMATFRQHMDAAINSGTLTGAQLQQWFAAAQALYNWTAAANQQTAATNAQSDAAAQAKAQADSFQLTLNQLGITTGLTGQKFIDFTSDLVASAGSLSNLESLWNTYFSEFYSASEQAAISGQQLHANATSQLQAIGENPDETLAQFRADFDKAMAAGLTSDQVIQWLKAGDALAQWNKYMDDSNTATTQAGASLQDAQQKYSQFIDGFNAIINPIDAFQSSMVSLGQTLQQNIDQANSLAIAAGMSGATAQDLGKILEASAIQGAQALQKEFADAQSLVASIWGTSLDALNTDLANEKANLAAVDPNSISAYGLQQYYQKQIDDTQKQIDAANAAAAQAAKIGQENSLLKDLGDIGSVTGQSFDALASQLGIPLDQLQKDLGLSKDQLEKQFSVYEQQALAAMGILNNTQTSNELLQDILDYYEGKPFSYTSTIADPTTDTRDAPGTGRHIGPIGTPGPATQYIAVLTSTPSVGGRNAQPIVVRLHPDDVQAITEQLRTGKPQHGKDRRYKRADGERASYAAIDGSAAEHALNDSELGALITATATRGRR